MVGISGLGGVAAYRAAAARRPGVSGFRVPEEGGAAERAAAAGSVSMPSLLGVQEAQQDAVTDREARRHAGEALDALRELQLALLGQKRGQGGLESLAKRMPDAADPGLRAVQRALLLRVAVEQARHRAAASL